MLTIEIPDSEMFDEEHGTFTTLKGRKLQLEHSLLSLSKWESKWNKPFLQDGGHSVEESIDYIRCMTITPNVDPILYNYMPDSIMEQIENYIKRKATATTIRHVESKTKSRKIITAEIIYYWMIALNIPFDPCQKWHLDRLLTLIDVCSIENSPKKKMSMKQIYEQNRAINEANRKKYHTRG